MELQQSLNDTKKEAMDNERTLQHWQNEHDKLKLEDIECAIRPFAMWSTLILICSDDDDEEESQEVPPEAVAETVDAGAPAPAEEGIVKPEPDAEEQPKKKTSARTSSYELHMYSAEELAGFKKREMIADAELLDGPSATQLLLFYTLA
jgi:structural maintenance of chromosome 4